MLVHRTIRLDTNWSAYPSLSSLPCKVQSATNNSKYISFLLQTGETDKQHSISELEIDNICPIWQTPTTAPSRNLSCSNNWLICFAFFNVSEVHRLNSLCFNHSQIQGASYMSFQHYSIAISHGVLVRR